MIHFAIRDSIAYAQDLCGMEFELYVSELHPYREDLLLFRKHINAFLLPHTPVHATLRIYMRGENHKVVVLFSFGSGFYRSLSPSQLPKFLKSCVYLTKEDKQSIAVQYLRILFMDITTRSDLKKYKSVIINLLGLL
jgi:hypothetical protein